MTAKRYHAHRALASVILGWVTFRVIVYQWPSPNDLPVYVSMPAPAPSRGGIVRASSFIRSTYVRTSGLFDATAVPIAAPTPVSNMIFEAALENRHVEPASVVHEDMAIVAARPGRSIEASVAPPDQPSTYSRLSLYNWVFVRQHSPSTNFVPEGQLGGSQAGIRALYRLDGTSAASMAALSVRVTRPLALNGGAEAGLGLEVQPIASLPIKMIFERRVRLEDGGRNAWSSFVAGGFYRQLSNTDWVTDGYIQAGFVGARQRDAFIDGAIGLAHPVSYDLELQAGVSAWGGIQPDVERLDIGPRVKGVLHAGALPIQWELSGRLRIVGRVRPASGMALTISSGF